MDVCADLWGGGAAGGVGGGGTCPPDVGGSWRWGWGGGGGGGCAVLRIGDSTRNPQGTGNGQKICPVSLYR